MTIRHTGDQPFRRPASTPRVLLAQATCDVPVRILSVEADGHIMVRCSAELRVGDDERLLIDYQGAHPGLVQVLARVTGFVRRDAASFIRMKCRAVHSAVGPPALYDFLTSFLRLEDIDTDTFTGGSAGWYYQFERRAAGAQPAPARVAKDERRRAPRVPVRVKLSWREGTSQGQGTAYNISVGGLFILTEGEVPAHGTSLLFAYPITSHARPTKVLIRARVCWIMDAGSNADAKGFGVEIERFANQADASFWKDYVQSELRFGSSVKVRTSR